ncbi:MAG: Potassium efflux system KefA protein / Small-conductance mechanosensitive channel [uncultured Nocardioidaceae bacterium]|uniref:Potassium efflux system KefA protein / Small-conductance mechanosensitive channel n=1 Tax=uncultured Nocardioidaceae bacterium TaxID=253824 RepID=A0A6J4LUF4_9ACTN|nr:MAG: Potassium efflux system KefA protein / Small-conductance mechanosensitive channel [uncultured Nocardioidaceae bacterium]
MISLFTARPPGPALEHVAALAAAPACEDGDQLCDLVQRTTGNEWLATAADWLIAKPVAIAVIIVLGLVARWLVNKLISRVVDKAAGGRTLPPVAKRRFGVAPDPEEERLAGVIAERRRQRAHTMASVLRSIASIVILTVVTIMVIGELGYDVGPLIASAGLVGVALGFGAQSLVKDFLSGIFMFFEDQLGVGDTVIIGETEGVVEALALRITRLRAEDGTVWYVRNGEILRVGNLSQRNEVRPAD